MNNVNVIPAPGTLSSHVIPERSAVAFVLKKGELLKIVDLEGEQVCDLVCFNLYDSKEYLSSGRTFDYEETIYLTKGNRFFSNRSNIMFEIVEDTVGRHDFLLAPCSAEMFRMTYGHEHPHRGCFGNLVEALGPYSIQPDQIPTCFNVFMNVTLDAGSGKLNVVPPTSRSGDHIVIKANMDLIVGMTACSAGMTNNFRFKPIGYSIL